MKQAERGRWRVLLAIIDIVLPLIVGAIALSLLWVLDISRCRGHENWDPSSHLITVLSMSNDPSVKWFYDTVYPPLTYYVTQILFLFMTPGRQAAELAVALFLLPFCLGAYTLGRAYGGRAAGVLCLLLPLLHSDFLVLGQAYLLDIPLITMVTLSLLAFHHAADLERRVPAIVLGLTLGLGMLTKYNFFFFVGPPLALLAVTTLVTARAHRLGVALLAVAGALAAFYSSQAVRGFMFDDPSWSRVLLIMATPLLALYLPVELLGRSRLLRYLVGAPEHYRRVRNGILAACLFITPSLPWYIFNLEGMLWSLNKNRGLGHEREHHAWLCLLSLNEPWLIAIPMMLVGLGLLWRARRQRWELASIAFGGVVAFIFMVNATDCNMRVFLGILPFLLVLATWWIRLLGRGGWIVTVAVLALELVAIQRQWTPGTRYNSVSFNVLEGEPRILAPRSQEENRRACLLDREVSALGHELRVLGDRARQVACIFWDQEQLSLSTRMAQYPGVNCQLLAVKMGRAFYQIPTVVLHSVESGWDRPQPLQANELDSTLFVFLGPHDFPVASVQARYLQLTGVPLRYLRYRPLRDKMGAHLLVPIGTR